MSSGYKMMVRALTYQDDDCVSNVCYILGALLLALLITACFMHIVWLVWASGIVYALLNLWVFFMRIMATKEAFWAEIDARWYVYPLCIFLLAMTIIALFDYCPFVAYCQDRPYEKPDQ